MVWCRFGVMCILIYGVLLAVSLVWCVIGCIVGMVYCWYGVLLVWCVVMMAP